MINTKPVVALTCFVFTMTLFLPPAISVNTPTFSDQYPTIRICSNVCQIEENGAWIPIEEAKSLKDKTYNGKPLFGVEYLQTDGEHDFEIIDFNYTTLIFKPVLLNSSKIGTKTPFKVDSYNIDDKHKEDLTLDTLSKNPAVVYKTDNVFSENYTLGDHSTTITLVTYPTDSLGDIRVEDGGGNFAYIGRWNISQIPDGVILQSAVLALYNFESYGSFDDDSIFWRINAQAWETSTASAGDLNGFSLDNQTSNVTWNETPAVNTWSGLDILPVIRADYDEGYENSSVWVEDPDETMGQDITAVSDTGENKYGNYNGGAGPLCKFDTADGGGGGPSKPPELRITYETTTTTTTTTTIPTDNTTITKTVNIDVDPLITCQSDNSTLFYNYTFVTSDGLDYVYSYKTCEYGCDSETDSCRLSPFELNSVMILGIFSIFILTAVAIRKLRG